MVSKQKILIVDDDNNIAELIALYLTKECFETKIVNDGEEALREFASFRPDLIILDLMLPGVDGFEICRQIRSQKNTPIIMVSAKKDDIDKIRGLGLGADDYMTKPFSPSEVMARLRAVLRRISRQSVETQSGQILRVSNMEVNLDEYTFCIDGKKIPMTKKEIETMWTLASTPGKVFTRDNLLDSLWGYDYYGDSRTVDSHIKRLRAKLDSVPHPDWTIKTIWGVGYKLEIAGGQ